MSRSSGARASAASRQCPECGRKAALTTYLPPGQVVRKCRWCGWEHVTDLTADPEGGGAA